MVEEGHFVSFSVCISGCTFKTFKLSLLTPDMSLTISSPNAIQWDLDFVRKISQSEMCQKVNSAEASNFAISYGLLVGTDGGWMVG